MKKNHPPVRLKKKKRKKKENVNNEKKIKRTSKQTKQKTKTPFSTFGVEKPVSMSHWISHGMSPKGDVTCTM